MLSFETAKKIADAALAEGARRGTAPLTVAVLDAGGHQLVLYRQTGSGFARPRIAIGKAWGALDLGFSSDTDEACAVIAARIGGLRPEPADPAVP